MCPSCGRVASLCLLRPCASPRAPTGHSTLLGAGRLGQAPGVGTRSAPGQTRRGLIVGVAAGERGAPL